MNNNNTVLQIPIEDLIPNRFQPRLSFDDASLKELAASIKEHGIIQPLVIRKINGKYEIIAGERRYRAAKMVGLLSVPAIINELSDGQSAEVAIVENVQRKDLTAIEEARSYKALLDKGLMSQEDLAKKMGLSQSSISNKLRLLSLSDIVQDAILNEKISERHARSLLKIENFEDQNKLLDQILTRRLTVKQLEEEIKKILPKKEEEVISPIDLTIEEDKTVVSEIRKTNKFFNFISDPIETKKEEEIEMLDDFFLPKTNEKLDKLKEFLTQEGINILEEKTENDQTILKLIIKD